MKTSILVAGLFTLVSMTQAQSTFSATLPFGYETTDGNYTCYPTGNPWFGVPFNNGSGTGIVQWAYRWSEFFHQCPVLITQLAFRRTNQAILSGATYPNIMIRLATLNPAFTSHTQLGNNFNGNLAADVTVVYSGPIVLPPNSVTGTIPAPWDIVVPLQVPFAYDPTKLRNLVVEVNLLAAPTAVPNFPVDGVFPHPGVAQVGFGSGATGNFGNADAGGIVQVTYQLGNPTDFDLILATTGGGTGDLFYQYLNMPAGALDGYTLISTTPTSTFGVPFGRGPVFGIWPDFITFNIILSPAIPGSPFHWLASGGGLFPDIPIAAPPGTLSSFAGQTWEVVGVALTPLGTVAGISPPRVLNW